ncbi:uncharacterized protein LOC111020403 [Momordica charantia]|uniref:Uncharacterized protein LOC111020403 n=1 Tax=Momordica charantia TaxID=3673 RepID=A0A6J1DGZ6_MOMCH|nr:uncharacterized protein LOC111020403 [Momordica charantia]
MIAKKPGRFYMCARKGAGVPELTQASFDTLKYYKERFPRGRKVGTLVTDQLLLESGLLDYNPAVRPIESSRPNSELAMVCGFASSVKRKSKGRAHALEAAQSSKPATPVVAGPASEDPAPSVS